MNPLMKFQRGLIILKRFSVFLLALTLLLSACSTQTPAPISDLRNDLDIQQGYHVVARGETLYFIAWRFSMDFQDLARINELKSPYQLAVGEQLYFSGKHQIYKYQSPARRKASPTPTPSAPALPTFPSRPVKNWISPANGKIINRYSNLNKGINIGGQLGEPVKATAAGEIVYAGDGLRGYGNLLLIKHNNDYLSAYAHNQVLLVKEGQWVTAGQVIAKMGSSDSNRVMLHFEIRKNGKPIDPLKLFS
jgi:lipoprotein NlpD